MQTQLAENLGRVRERVAAAAARAGRAPEAVQLIAVSKTKPAAAVLEALAAGQVLFGENRVQEALSKMEAVQAALAAQPAGAQTPQPQWHLIGHLQRNKARFVPGQFAALQSLDTPRLAEALGRAAGQAGPDGRPLPPLPVYLQLNWNGEDTKAGARDWAELAALAEAAAGQPALDVVGLMTIPDPSLDEKATRALYGQMRELLGRVRQAAGFGPRFQELSMGMSHDFEWAIEEGATCVRVGTAIFGARP